MQTTADLIRALVELTSSVENSHYYLQGALVQFLVLINRDTASIVLHGDRLVFVDGNLYVRAIASHSLIDGVVYSLVYQMVKTFLAYIANIHSRALAHGLKTLKHLDVTGRIIILSVLICCHFWLFA